MPVRVNGIGTTYIGERNKEAYGGTCGSCRREAQLRNSATTLWFTVFFVPLVPLGKKQIFEYCPICRRHKMMPLAKWEEIKQNAIDKNREAWNNNPNDPKIAVQFLETLQAFHRDDEAAELANTMQSRFAGDVAANMAVGQWYESAHKLEDAERCYLRALKLDPSHVPARRAVAVSRIQKDDPVSAARLLREPPEITAQADPQLHFWLAKAYHKQGQHSEALTGFQQVFQTAPKLANDAKIRKLVRESELALGQQESVLPHKPFYKTNWFWPVAAVSAILFGLLAWNWIISRHRTLNVINGFNVPLQVALDGGQTTTVPPHGRMELSVAEGKHVATVNREGAQPENVDFNVAANFFDRYFRSPAFVLNPNGAAPVIWEQTVYAERPVQGQNPFKLHLNQPFVSYADIDYIFVPFPHTIELHANTETKTRLHVIEIAPEDVLGIPDKVSNDDKLQFGETHLTADPTNASLLQLYAGVAIMADQKQRAVKFLEAGLDRRPITVGWHRMYQSLVQNPAEKEAIKEKYRKLLAADPNNAALMYLVGRLEKRRDKALELYDRSIKTDPTLFYPWYAKSYLLQSSGEFLAARQCAAEAQKLAPNDAEMQDLWFKVRLANGEFASLEKELRAELDAHPINVTNNVKFMEVLAAEGNTAEVQKLQQKFEQAVSQALPDIQQTLVKISQATAWYLTKKFQQILDAFPAGQPESGYQRFIALLELGRIDEAGASLSAMPRGHDNAYDELCLAIASRQRNNPAQADRWETAACQHLADVDFDGQYVADLLRKAPQVTQDEVAQIVMRPGEKSVVLIALAQKCPELKQQLLELAGKLNYEFTSPHYFLASTIAAEKAKP